jgi:hypothetical protein
MSTFARALLRRRSYGLTSLPLLPLLQTAPTTGSTTTGCPRTFSFLSRFPSCERVLGRQLGVEGGQGRKEGGFLEVGGSGGGQVHGGPLASRGRQVEFARLSSYRILIHVLLAELVVDCERLFKEPGAGLVAGCGLVAGWKGGCLALRFGACGGLGPAGRGLIHAPKRGGPGLNACRNGQRLCY